MFKRLDRYVWREALLPFLAILGLSVALLVVNRLFKVLPLLFEVNVPLGEIASAIAWLVPSFLVFGLPIAAWVAWTVGFGRLGIDGEVTALASLGVSPWRMTRPAVVVAVTATLTALAVSQWGYGQGRMRFRQQVQDLARTAAVRSLQPGTLIELPGGVWVGVGRGVDAAIFVVRDPDFVMTATAAEPLSDAVGLRLRNGLILPRSATEPTVLAFADGILRLGGLDQAVTSGARERDLVALWRNRAAVDYAVEMQQRLALSASLLLAPFGGFLIAPRRARSGRVSALLVSLTALAGYYAAFTFGKQAALKGWLPVAPALWAANVAAALLMTWAMVRRHRRAGLP